MYVCFPWTNKYIDHKKVAHSFLFKGGLGHIVEKTGPVVEPELIIYCNCRAMKYRKHNIYQNSYHNINKIFHMVGRAGVPLA